MVAVVVVVLVILVDVVVVVVVVVVVGRFGWVPLGCLGVGLLCGWVWLGIVLDWVVWCGCGVVRFCGCLRLLDCLIVVGLFGWLVWLLAEFPF